jgi:hypothetical protein
MTTEQENKLRDLGWITNMETESPMWKVLLELAVRVGVKPHQGHKDPEWMAIKRIAQHLSDDERILLIANPDKLDALAMEILLAH